MSIESDAADAAIRKQDRIDALVAERDAAVARADRAEAEKKAAIDYWSRVAEALKRAAGSPVPAEEGD